MSAQKGKVALTENHSGGVLLKTSIFSASASSGAQHSRHHSMVFYPPPVKGGPAIWCVIHDLHDDRERPPQKAEMIK